MKSESRLKTTGGAAVIECAVLLPFLFLLVFGVIDYARAIQANNVVTSISREGANIAARTPSEFQPIMDALTSTAQSLDMSSKGMMYITEILGMGEAPGVVPRVVAQSKWVGGGGSYEPSSEVWPGCGGFDGQGRCLADFAAMSDYQARADVNGLAIKEGERVFAVEAFYNYQPITTYVMKKSIELHSAVIL